MIAALFYALVLITVYRLEVESSPLFLVRASTLLKPRIVPRIEYEFSA